MLPPMRTPNYWQLLIIAVATTAGLAFARATEFETNCLDEPVPLSITLWR